jgi:RHS repeat-associated protein
VPQSIGFTGHVNDVDTGLVYMQQRYYDPIAGRFLSVDPVTTDAKTGGHFNRYVYADNNPYKYTDPDGRSPVHAGLKALDLAVSAIDIMSAFHTGGAGAGLRATLETVLAPPGAKVLGKIAGVVGDATKVAREATTTVRTTRSGETAMRTTNADGSVVDVSPTRVKEYVPNTHPNAPPGTLDKVKFEDALPGSKGYKRAPTNEELKKLEEVKKPEPKQ